MNTSPSKRSRGSARHNVARAKEYLQKQKMEKTKPEENSASATFTNDSVKRIVAENDNREKLKNGDPNKDKQEEEVEYEAFEGDPVNQEKEAKSGQQDEEQGEEEDERIDGTTLLFYMEMLGVMVAVPFLCRRAGKEVPEPEKMAFTPTFRATMLPSAEKVAKKMKTIPPEWVLLGGMFAYWAPIVKNQPLAAEEQEANYEDVEQEQ